MSLTYDFEVDDDGLWKCEWIPLPDGGWSLSRSEEVVGCASTDSAPPGDILPNASDEDLNDFFSVHARAISNEFRVSIFPPPGARKRQRAWDRRKVHVLLRERAATAGLVGPLASLYDIPEELFRAVVMCL